MAGRTTGIEVRGTAGVYTGEGHDHVATEGADLRLASATRLADTPVALLRECAAPVILAVHESVPLPLLIRRVNKNSDNEWAERVLEAAGAETYGGSANTAKGVRALRDALTDLGVPSSGYSPANGSGLGHQNRVAPATMADLLRKLYFDPRVGPDLLQALSVGGVDGTTAIASVARRRRNGCAPRPARSMACPACRATWATSPTWWFSPLWSRASVTAQSTACAAPK
jgi:hypothetical protein